MYHRGKLQPYPSGWSPLQGSHIFLQEPDLGSDELMNPRHTQTNPSGKTTNAFALDQPHSWSIKINLIIKDLLHIFDSDPMKARLKRHPPHPRISNTWWLDSIRHLSLTGILPCKLLDFVQYRTSWRCIMCFVPLQCPTDNTTTNLTIPYNINI